MFNNKLKNIDINKIQANVNQPRTVFNEAKIDELAASIKDRSWLINISLYFIYVNIL